ncbi:MAG: DNA polymerase IV [Verrucomicrobiae bacterium]|nr:DNA polymerase IV [Verrucomicrobiae bacterium]
MKARRSQRILHVDGDAYFASCEIALDPKLRGRPVFVGGGRRGDGIVIAANYLAKRYGVKTGMACFEAKRLCPDGVLVKPHYDEYRRLSLEMFRLIRRYTPLLVPTSIDEGFLDFTDMPDVFGCANAEELVRRMKRELMEEVGIPISAGLGSSRWLAKLATESCKPDGFREVAEAEERAFLRDIPVEKLAGVAERRARELRALGVWTLGDVAVLPLEILRRRFGTFGEELWLLARGELRERLSLSQKPRTCIGSATTLPYDESNYESALLFLLDQTERVIATFVRENLKANEMGVYVRFKDLDGAGLSVRVAGAQFEPGIINAEVERIFWQLVAGRTEPIRQVCVNFWNMEPLNLEPDLFGYNRDFKCRQLQRARESIEEQFGKGSIKTGTRLLLEKEAGHLIQEKPKCPFIPQREMELKVLELEMPRTWGRSTSRAVKFG